MGKRFYFIYFEFRRGGSFRRFVRDGKMLGKFWFVLGM